MRYRRYKEWLLLEIDDSYDLKKIADFMEDYKLTGKQNEWFNGKMLLNRYPVKPETYLKKGDTLQILAFPNEQVDFESDPQLPEVVYEDDFLLVVNKPRGIIIYPEAKIGTGTLANQVAAYYREKGIQTTVRPIHRLDKDTTGLVIFSKSPFLQPKLDYMLMHRQIHRYYYAFVEGVIEQDGKIDMPIGNDRHDARKMRVDKNGKKAVTNYHVVRNQRNFTLLECLLDTGRTHQIRVHMAYIKHPIVNDTLYGEPFDNIEMGLQAFKIIMVHPITGKTLRVELNCAF